MLMRMPGGRHFSTPTINSTAAAIDAISIKESPRSQMSDPTPGSSVASGGYMNQPDLGAASNSTDPRTKTPPIRNDQ